MFSRQTRSRTDHVFPIHRKDVARSNSVGRSFKFYSFLLSLHIAHEFKRIGFILTGDSVLVQHVNNTDSGTLTLVRRRFATTWAHKSHSNSISIHTLPPCSTSNRRMSTRATATYHKVLQPLSYPLSLFQHNVCGVVAFVFVTQLVAKSNRRRILGRVRHRVVTTSRGFAYANHKS